MIGQIVSHYKILEKLGEGGMGIVYKAHDTKLDRTVALKFLPPQISATEQDKVRFTQEARAAAALNHPHICHIYRIDEVDAPPASGRTGEKLMFIEMEYVDGLTLRKKIAAAPIPLAEALELATQVGEGLEEAHGKGIVHRDIKSDNVMLNSRNQAKVMDFGLAKLKGALKLTRSSSTVGTLSYMAPEQLRGAEADARSDIYSFGVLLYEMLTARVPFEGAHEAALMYSITNEPPVPLERYIPDAPPELVHIINRSLEKDPEDRYQNVHDMVIDIRRMRKDSTRVSRASMPVLPAEDRPVAPDSSVHPAAPSGAIRPSSASPSTASVPVSMSEPAPRRTSSVTIQIPTGRRTWVIAVAAVVVLAVAITGYLRFAGSDEGTGHLSIAVADFQNRTNEPELDGLSGMLITAMEQSRRLSVVTRTHMFDILKQMGKSDVAKIDEGVGKEICAKAGIGALVTASIQKFGKLYTIDLKVLDPTKNEYLFTAKEEGEGQESIPGMLDKLSEKTRAGLKEKSDEISHSTADLAVVTTTNMEAYQHYFKGEEYLNKLDMRKAEAELRQAVALDSLFGLAWYRLAYVLGWTFASQGLSNDVLPRALALIDRLPDKEKYMLRAIATLEKSGFKPAIGVLKEMETHYPDDKEMVYNIGDWSFHTNDLNPAVEYLNKTLALDPMHERALQHLTWTYRGTGQFEKMLETARRYEAVAHTNESLNLVVESFWTLGREEEGVRELSALRASQPGRPAITVSISDCLRIMGKVDEAERELDGLVGSGDSAAVSAGRKALVTMYEATGQYRKALVNLSSGLESAIDRKDTAAMARMHISRAFTEYFLSESIPRTGESLAKALACPAPYSNTDYWFAVTMLNVVVHPDAEYLPFMKGKPWTPFYDAIRAGIRGDCAESATAVDSVNKLGVAQAIFTCGIYLSECYFHAARYSDALAALTRALGERSMYGSSFYPKAVLLLGEIQEEMGNKKDALATYQKFLALWKRADTDLPAMVDARKRAAKLRAVASN